MAKASNKKTKPTKKAKAIKPKAKKKAPTRKRPAIPAKRRPNPNTPYAVARRDRIARIRARTRASQDEIDELAAGADMTDLAHLPVIVETGPSRRPEGSWQDGYSRADPEARAIRRKTEERQAAAANAPRESWSLPHWIANPTKKCARCKQPDHPTMSCRDLARWLDISGHVLAGETGVPRMESATRERELEPEPEPPPPPPPPRAPAPPPIAPPVLIGKRVNTRTDNKEGTFYWRGRRRPLKPEAKPPEPEIAADVRTDSAVASCPPPSPSP